MVELRRTSRLFGWSVDGAPGVLFVIVYLISRDFRLATMVLVAAAVIALAASLVVERRLRPLPTATGALAVVFGGASLLLRSPDILKMKMSIVDGLLGASLFVGLAIRKNPLKMILGGAFALPDAAWATLAIRYGLFWWACALANELVRRTQSDHTWVLFRAGALAAAVIFALAQAPFLLKHNAIGDKVDAPPPDLGV
ncbi:MAG TPA: septation protein IspZ [Caulobacteraceae bacterium]|jgi:intracellular septation protein|nr:septation protein IspZ [Caulobacteraceae bacterium]